MDEKTEEKHEPTFITVKPMGQATLLAGHPIITNISAWCHKHNRRLRGSTPTLAVVYFDTGEDAEEYIRVKALVAAHAGIGYTTHALHPKAPLSSVIDMIGSLNQSDSAHGILIQRPLPSHLSERKVMDSISRVKHIEEFTHERPSNIALESLERLLSFYRQSHLLSLNTILLGGTNIITPNFIAQLASRHGRPAISSHPPFGLATHTKDTIVITELNQDGAITPSMLEPQVKLVVDMGFDVHTKQGDLDPDVLDMEGLVVVPTPGGVLPVLLWVMMERTIRARDRLMGEEEGPKCCVIS